MCRGPEHRGKHEGCEGREYSRMRAECSGRRVLSSADCNPRMRLPLLGVGRPAAAEGEGAAGGGEERERSGAECGGGAVGREPLGEGEARLLPALPALPALAALAAVAAVGRGRRGAEGRAEQRGVPTRQEEAA